MKKYIQPKLKCISLTVLLHHCSCRQGDDPSLGRCCSLS